MNELNIQKFLRENSPKANAFALLESEYGISAKQSDRYPELYQFNYDQIDSYKVKESPIVRECRGLILSEDLRWEVIAYPFNRFFNYGESEAEMNVFDWSNFDTYEKLDGSLIILYYYAGQWQIATRNSIHASGNVGNEPFTFEELVHRVVSKDFFENLMPLNTYMFELTSKYNRVVTNQIDNEGKLTLIGIRDNILYQEFDLKKEEKYILELGINVVERFEYTSDKEILDAAENLNPNEQEGFILVDKNFNRMKIKSSKYVQLHHLRFAMTPERMVELILSGETPEILVYFPDLQKVFLEYEEKLKVLESKLEYDWNSIPVMLRTYQKEDKKEFALYVKNFMFSSCMFSLYDRRVKTVYEWIRKNNPKKIIEMLEKL